MVTSSWSLRNIVEVADAPFAAVFPTTLNGFDVHRLAWASVSHIYTCEGPWHHEASPDEVGLRRWKDQLHCMHLPDVH